MLDATILQKFASIGGRKEYNMLCTALTHIRGVPDYDHVLNAWVLQTHGSADSGFRGFRSASTFLGAPRHPERARSEPLLFVLQTQGVEICSLT